MASGPEATIFALDDDRDALAAMVVALEDENYRVRAFHSPMHFLAQFVPVHPCCMLTDLRMPEISGLELMWVLQQRQMCPPTVMISGHANVDICAEAFKQGVVDFLEKPFGHERLLQGVALALARDSANGHADAERETVLARFERLTAREKDIIALVVSDLSNKEIAKQLKISPKTVEHHRAHVMRKMQANSLHDLIIMAVICGLHDLRLPK